MATFKIYSPIFIARKLLLQFSYATVRPTGIWLGRMNSKLSFVRQRIVSVRNAIRPSIHRDRHDGRWDRIIQIQLTFSKRSTREKCLKRHC